MKAADELRSMQKSQSWSKTGDSDGERFMALMQLPVISGKWRLVPMACLFGLALGGCISSPPWEYGPTAEAKKLHLGPCKNGMLDDAEDGDTQIIKAGGRDGYWYTFADQWGSTVDPKGKFRMQEGGPPGSRYAARITGKTAKAGESIYVGMGFSFTNPKMPYDASWAKGIRFWGKGPGRVRLEAMDVNTSPEGDRCTDCYNHFGVDISLQSDWQRYTVPFEKLAQQPGWGDRAPHVTTDQLFGIQWQFRAPDKDYDIWIDQVELVGCDEPAGEK